MRLVKSPRRESKGFIKTLSRGLNATIATFISTGPLLTGMPRTPFTKTSQTSGICPLNNPICASCKAHRGQRNEVWQYPQRIDVEKWEHWVQKGVPLKGLDKAVRSISGSYRIAAFKIP